MQNKGFVKAFAILLTLVCVFYLSFSFVTRHYTNKAREIANGDPQAEQNYLDSLANEKVWLWNWSLKDCREMEIGLGLDLKGGMNVILEVSVTSRMRHSTRHWLQPPSKPLQAKMTSLHCLSVNTTAWHPMLRWHNCSPPNS